MLLEYQEEVYLKQKSNKRNTKQSTYLRLWAVKKVFFSLMGCLFFHAFE